MQEKKNVSIYTDGGCIGNPGPGGYGVVLRYGEHEKRLSGGFQQTTNNRMEIMAAIVGLEALKAPCSVTLHSDSRYLVDAMSLGWVQRWKANGWRRNKKDKAVNVDLWERLLEACRRHEVAFMWVRGHAGHQWNEICDVLSKEAASRKDLPVDEGYEQQSGVADVPARTCSDGNAVRSSRRKEDHESENAGRAGIACSPAGGVLDSTTHRDWTELSVADLACAGAVGRHCWHCLDRSGRCDHAARALAVSPGRTASPATRPTWR